MRIKFLLQKTTNWYYFCLFDWKQIEEEKEIKQDNQFIVNHNDDCDADNN